MNLIDRIDINTILILVAVLVLSLITTFLYKLIYFNNKELSLKRKKNTFDTVLELDKTLSEFYTKLDNEIKNEYKSINRLTEKNSKYRQSTLKVLNHCEYISIAIREGIINEEIILLMNKSSLINTYKLLRPAIESYRMECNQSTIFVNFDWLMNRWMRRSDTNE